MDKLKALETEINYIKNDDIKKDLIEVVNIIPDYFFVIPASTTGKYHPSFSLGEGGLLRHTKFATRIAKDLLDLEMYKQKFNERQRDLILYSIIMHDSFKCGIIKEEFTRFDHPIIAAQEITKHSKLKEKEEIAGIVKSHMGQWNKDKFGKTVMPKPQTESEKFVHMCDFLSSKRYLNSKFINNEMEDLLYVRS